MHQAKEYEARIQLTSIKECPPETVRGFNAGEASESAVCPCPFAKSAGVAHLLFIKLSQPHSSVSCH